MRNTKLSYKQILAVLAKFFYNIIYFPVVMHCVLKTVSLNFSNWKKLKIMKYSFSIVTENSFSLIYNPLVTEGA